MNFLKIAELFSQLEQISSGNKLRELLSKFLKSVPKNEIDKFCYLALGRIGAEYAHTELGISDKTILKAIGKDSINVYKKLGDVGLVAEKLISSKGKKLELEKVFYCLHEIAFLSGVNSQEKKISMLSSLLSHSSQLEAKYIARIAAGELRLGIATMTLLDSLAIAFAGNKSAKKELEHAYNICSDIGMVAKTMAFKGLNGIKNIPITPGIPIKMMLAQRVKSLNELEFKMPGLKAAEEKYDGERIQAHKFNGKIKLFSRRLDDITEQFPDLVNALKKVKAKSFVIEGEAIPIDKKGHPLAFQLLMQRRRKYNIAEYTKKIPLHLMLFDLLFLNKKTYLHSSYFERHKKLETIIPKNEILKIAGRIITKDISELEDFFMQSLDSGYEGIIAKNLSSSYLPGSRGYSWIKWKKDYVTNLKDSFDLVIVGAFAGRGRRAGKYGALLCALYDKSTDSFKTFTKLGAGFTDKMLENLPRLLSKYKVNKKPARLELGKIKPDFFFEPSLVIEVLGAEITKSPVHSSGIALRFPRFIRIREDKQAEQATSVKEAKNLS